MAAVNEIRISISDLTRLSIQCKNCAAEIAIDTANEKQPAVPDQIKCPICVKPFDAQLLKALHKFFDFQTDTRESVFFHIQLSTNEVI